ncbi:S8 family serine peptidase [Mesorhizobium sp. M0910]|uniref:S8 family peptidase n=1 Tax=Mesorhizobium sp. M0910 TaxID=2957025 RepID=UPI0033394ADD
MVAKKRLNKSTDRYVIIPNNFDLAGETESTQFLKSLNTRAAKRRPLYKMTRRAVASDVGEFKVIDSVDLSEAALVEMTSDQAHELAHHYPSLRVVKEVRLRPLRTLPLAAGITQPKLPKANPINTLTVTVVSKGTGRPVPNTELIIIFNAKTGQGITNKWTDAQGQMTTPLPNALNAINSIIAVPKAGYWPGEIAAIVVNQAGNTQVTVEVIPIGPKHKDGLDIIGPKGKNRGAGVRIAIIDTGADQFEGLDATIGKNTTGVDAVDKWEDTGVGHGTHVAGIIRRIAPDAELFIYRVFGGKDETAGEVAISKAIRDAVDNNCDLINLSLGQATEALSISRETRRARQLGTVCVAAAGNDYMSSVLYPARSSHMLAVSACGAIDSWPVGSSTGRYVAKAPAPIQKVFFGTFSNVGNELDFIAPGVGIISWVSKTEKGVMDGTSMACPVITAKIAGLLSTNQALMAADRDQQRSDDIIKLAFVNAKAFGFGAEFEGSGFIT